MSASEVIIPPLIPAFPIAGGSLSRRAPFSKSTAGVSPKTLFISIRHRGCGHARSSAHVRVLSDEEVRTRLANRRKTDGRADDQFVDERLAEYKEYTLPALEIFRQANVLIEIDGHGGECLCCASALIGATVATDR